MTLLRRLTATDRAVLAGAAVLLAALYAGLWSHSGSAGDTASVWVAGERRQVLSLDQRRTLRVDGPLGVSVIEVRNGRIRVTDSPGRRKLCVRAGWLTQGGESAICLPNQVVVRVESERPRFDTVVF